VRISGSNAGYTMFRGSVKGTGLRTPFASFPFTSLPVRHRVPSHFKWPVPLKCMYFSTRLHGDTSQKTVIFIFTTMRNSNSASYEKNTTTQPFPVLASWKICVLRS
jgi:hypothetical protein